MAIAPLIKINNNYIFESSSPLSNTNTQGKIYRIIKNSDSDKDKNRYALKRVMHDSLDITEDSNGIPISVLNEIIIGKWKPHHPNLMYLYDVFQTNQKIDKLGCGNNNDDDNKNNNGSTTTESNFDLVMPLAKYDLKYWNIKRWSRDFLQYIDQLLPSSDRINFLLFSDEKICKLLKYQTIKFLHDIACGLSQLHLNGVAQGDGQLNNHLIFDPNNIDDGRTSNEDKMGFDREDSGYLRAVVSDFGTILPSQQFSQSIYLGAPVYGAPEAHCIDNNNKSKKINNWNQNAQKLDIWSYGCLLIELCFGIDISSLLSSLGSLDNTNDIFIQTMRLIGPPPIRLANKLFNNHDTANNLCQRTYLENLNYFDKHGTTDPTFESRRKYLRNILIPNIETLDFLIIFGGWTLQEIDVIVDMILRCLSWDPNERPTMTQILSDFLLFSNKFISDQNKNEVRNQNDHDKDGENTSLILRPPPRLNTCKTFYAFKWINDNISQNQNDKIGQNIAMSPPMSFKKECKINIITIRNANSLYEKLLNKIDSNDNVEQQRTIGFKTKTSPVHDPRYRNSGHFIKFSKRNWRQLDKLYYYLSCIMISGKWLKDVEAYKISNLLSNIIINFNLFDKKEIKNIQEMSLMNWMKNLGLAQEYLGMIIDYNFTI